MTHTSNMAAATTQKLPRKDSPRTEPSTLTNPEIDDHLEITADLFAEPAHYYPPTPPPTHQTYRPPTLDPPIRLRLVGSSPGEAHHLWNASRVLADHFFTHPASLHNRTVLELGAGAGLPSLAAASLGARRVVATDFPDPDLLENLVLNIDACAPVSPPDARDQWSSCILATGYVWGADPTPLLSLLSPTSCATPGFDMVILADLLFRHSEHRRLLDSVAATLRRCKDAYAWVVYTSYRPWLAHKDQAFFTLARECGFVVERVIERKMERPLFEEDPGDEEVRKTVTGYTLRWHEEEWRGSV